MMLEIILYLILMVLIYCIISFLMIDFKSSEKEYEDFKNCTDHHKVCSVCGKFKHVTKFNKKGRKGKPQELRANCKKCQSVYDKKYNKAKKCL